MGRLLGIILLLVSINCQGATWQITYPRPISDSDMRSTYPLQLLSLALDQTGVNYTLMPSDLIMLQNKALKRLTDNRDVNVVWSMTDTVREDQLLPIRIPIYKGLIGWRLLLIRDDMTERFKYIQKFEHLIKLNPLQGRGWPDTKILQANGFDVVIEDNYSNLFNLLRKAQGDFFPRSVVEVWGEVDNTAFNENLMIEQYLAIKYPAAMYFFVNKKSVPLANLIKSGLEKAIKNGKFDELFLQAHQKNLDQANISDRRVFELKNSFLPPATPLARKELWYQEPQYPQ
ncbi:MAG: hypothetical protein ACI8R9_001399 [Paraglaciecola sp.]|jgi:hypothetical protein